MFASPLSAQRVNPPVPDYASLTDERAIQLCDQYAAHPLDPMRASGIAGISADADVANDAAYIACNRALIADQTNPRILFQWGRVNYARTGNNTGQPRHMFKLAYEGGSEIAGVYLARLPPEKTMDELVANFLQKREELTGAPRNRPMTGQERDQLLAASVITIYSAALLRILSGEAGETSMQCSGTAELNPYTNEWSCNGLNMGPYSG